RLIPAGETEFAKDAAFGYTSSNLKQWVEEKTKGGILENQVSTISISLLRKEGPDAVCQLLCSLEKVYDSKHGKYDWRSLEQNEGETNNYC
uniref:Four-carbon acid sugar kinase N-terminal domain-containing protein n=1 Tax=Aegilops tauschii subsp. strangulata TaxID=200361 RepID=A0A453RAN4_AEGTS